MIKILNVDYMDTCSCCEVETKIVKLLDSNLSSIDFCEYCWKELIDKLDKGNFK